MAIWFYSRKKLKYNKIISNSKRSWFKCAGSRIFQLNTEWSQGYSGIVWSDWNKSDALQWTKLNDTCLVLQKVIEAIILYNGNNNFKVPHICKRKLRNRTTSCLHKSLRFCERESLIKTNNAIAYFCFISNFSISQNSIVILTHVSYFARKWNFWFALIKMGQTKCAAAPVKMERR